MEQPDPAELAYDSFAAVYDDFTHRNDYEMWFGILLPRLEPFGLKTGRLLDVACGTGRAFAPMLHRGWHITACDISAEMVARARKVEPGAEQIKVCDMRELPVYGSFELVWALNDAVNYLLGDGDLQLAFRAMAANLAPEGLLVFDCNTQRLFREFFGGGSDDAETEGERWTWRGLGNEGPVWEAELSGPAVKTHRHRERHRPVSEIQAALAEAGLVPLAALGQREDDGGLAIADEWDEDRDHKILHVARRG